MQLISQLQKIQMLLLMTLNHSYLMKITNSLLDTKLFLVKLIQY